jgi:hypothetical protein
MNITNNAFFIFNPSLSSSRNVLDLGENLDYKLLFTGPSTTGLRGSRASAPSDSARRDNKETVAETGSCLRPFEANVERQKYFKALPAVRASFFSFWGRV